VHVVGVRSISYPLRNYSLMPTYTTLISLSFEVNILCITVFKLHSLIHESLVQQVVLVDTKRLWRLNANATVSLQYIIIDT
jgi:hypothetical protein